GLFVTFPPHQPLRATWQASVDPKAKSATTFSSHRILFFVFFARSPSSPHNSETLTLTLTLIANPYPSSPASAARSRRCRVSVFLFLAISVGGSVELLRLRSQMLEEDLVELRFRLYDGSDIGPMRYSSSSTVAMLKERIVSEWPKDKKIAPKAATDVKLINAGKVLENNKTIGQCKPAFGELPGAIKPSSDKTKEKKIDELPEKKTPCSCSIL
ncbi:Membrane-anchored ubiquitin-fold protein 4, partial [Ananas comosus]